MDTLSAASWFQMVDPTQEFELFRTMASAIAGEFGEAFLERLVVALSSTLEAEFVAVTRGEGDPVNFARAICAWKGGAITDDGSFALEGTPCVVVFEGDELVIPCDLAKHYPNKVGMQSYIGLPLRSADGRVGGHILVVSPTELVDPEVALSILRVFATRAESELRRLEFEDERQRLIADLESQSARLEKAWDRARDANAFKTRLLGLIAHDLRGPLGAISAQAELAQTLVDRMADAPPALVRSCAKIVRNVERMAEQIEATLERSQAESRSLVPVFKTGDIVQTARKAMEANAAHATAKQIGLEFRGPDSLTACHDEDLIRPAIDNLIANAIKYTYPGGRARVEIVSSGDAIEISVEDTGQGLTQADCSRAFLPFETLSAKPTANETSTGLGLANVRAVMEAHGGEASVASGGRDQGARFTMRLPRNLEPTGPDMTGGAEEA